MLATKVAAEEFLERREGNEGELTFSLPEGGMARDVTTCVTFLEKKLSTDCNADPRQLLLPPSPFHA